MTRVLAVTSSPRGEASVSTRIVDAIVHGVVSTRPTVEVDRWDLWSEPLPTFGPDEVEAKMAAICGDEPSGRAGDAWKRIGGAFARMDAADIYVFGVPMWNGGVPWVLKHWIDTITQPGLLFHFDPDAGYRGLMVRKRAAVAYTSSVYQPGIDSAYGVDHHSTYFEAWLKLAGIEDVHPVRLQPSHPGSAHYVERERVALARARRVGEMLASDPPLQPDVEAFEREGSVS